MPRQAFLCHNSRDKPIVRELRDILQDADVETWFDEDDIPLGVKWYEYIFDHMEDFAAVVVFIGPHGIGGVQGQEVERVLRKADGDNTPIIPVLLPGFHDAKPRVPDWIQSQLVEKWNHVDLSLDPPGGVRRLAHRLAGGSKGPLDSGLMATFRERHPAIADVQKEEMAFRLLWVFLHVVGFLAVGALMAVEASIAFKLVGVSSATLAILFGLLAVGWRQVRIRGLEPIWSGAITGGGAALLLSAVFIRLVDGENPLAFVGSLATSLGTSAVAGVVGGWPWGLAAAAAAALGATLATLLAPTVALPIGSHSAQWDPVMFFASVSGTVLWAAVVGHLLLWLMKQGRYLGN